MTLTFSGTSNFNSPGMATIVANLNGNDSDIKFKILNNSGKALLNSIFNTSTNALPNMIPIPVFVNNGDEFEIQLNAPTNTSTTAILGSVYVYTGMQDLNVTAT